MTQSSPQDNTKPTLPLELVISEMTEQELDKIDNAVDALSSRPVNCLSPAFLIWQPTGPQKPHQLAMRQ